MTGTCKLCRALVMSPPILELGPNRAKAEFLAFGEAMRGHVYDYHREALAAFSGVLGLATCYFSTLFADTAAGLVELEAARDQVREEVISSLRNAQVVVKLKLDAPAAPVNPAAA